ncbi:MAG: hypothetical protein BWY74_03749 [Firmicutes bacterium ADurb.Bin419]|nr:MAG: hypothetical protein BWY74_03749 [Firmicutes bacterium ADurb.Bin419]
MKLDYDFLKSILKEIRDNPSANGYHVTRIPSPAGNPDGSIWDDFDKKVYHYKILRDGGYVYCDINEIKLRGEVMANEIVYQGLTELGHNLLEAMENDTVWNHIKDGVKEQSVAMLKQIPALAVTFLKSYIQNK